MTSDQYLIRIKNYISRMPSLPITVTKIMEICNTPNASPVDLNRVISLDPVLMARVLKLINSAYYGLPQKITSLVRAIIMLGLNTVKNLALSTAVLGTLGKPSDFQALNMEGFWRHSLCTGVTSKLIARHRGVDPKQLEEYFIAGLLHDIGKIPMNGRLSEEYVQAMSLSDREQIPLHQAERRVLGFTHSDVGQLIVENWKLGTEVLDPLVYHHRIDEYEGSYADVVFTVIAANMFANASEIGFSGDRYPGKLPPRVLEHLGIDWDFLDDIEDQVHAEIDKAKVFLQISG